MAQGTEDQFDGDGPELDEIGVSGLEQYGGIVVEEKLRQLQGKLGVRVYKQMVDNDATVGAILFAIEMLLRKVTWRVESVSDAPDDKDCADFIDGCRDDMSQSWASFISEVVTMLTFGWASHEIVYKKRIGPTETDPAKRSKFTDGKIGWRKLPLRAQETLNRWEFDEDGGIRGWWQDPPQGGSSIPLPIEKLLHFRTTSKKNNPEGRSVLRTAYKAWYRKDQIEHIESIGIERDLAGLPVIYLPEDIMDPNADAATRATLASYKQMIRRLKNNEQAGVVLPSVWDEQGNQLLKLELLGTGARRLFDTNAIIGRYRNDIATTILADVILMGHEKVGSFALSDNKTYLLGVALSSWLDEICSVFNRFAIPRLLLLNGEDVEETPQLKAGDIEKEDLSLFAEQMAKLTTAGWLTPGSPEDEEHVREKMNMPKLESVTPPEPEPTMGVDPATGLPAPPPAPGAPPVPPAPGAPKPPPPGGAVPDPTETTKIGKGYNPDQPRDEDGKWGEGGGAASADSGAAPGGGAGGGPTEAQKITIREYVSGDAGSANVTLRSGGKLSSYEADVVRDMDGAIERSPAFDKETTLYRRVDEGLADKHMKVGGEFRDKGYMSTSNSESKTEGFGQDDGGRSTLIRIKAPAGTRSIEPNRYLGEDDRRDEGEHILARGTRLRFTSESRSKTGERILTAEIIR